MTHVSHIWQDQARKAGGDELVTIIEGVANDVHSIKTTLDKLTTAFPNNDLDGHRVYHEAMIERNRELKRLTQVIREKTIIGLLWMALAGTGIAIWHEFLSYVAKGQ